MEQLTSRSQANFPSWKVCIHSNLDSISSDPTPIGWLLLPDDRARSEYSLVDVRSALDQQLSRQLPEDYQFVWKGLPLMDSQEALVYLTTLEDNMICIVSKSGSSDSTHVGDLFQNHSYVTLQVLHRRAMKSLERRSCKILQLYVFTSARQLTSL